MNTKTRCESLQAKLTEWCEALDVIDSLQHLSSERNDAMIEFVRGFAPGDVEEEDIVQYAGSLYNDEEFFGSLRRELRQCESGQMVEKISDNQRTRAEFTLRPLEGQLREGGASLDIVRELVFILDANAGGVWRAEG
jgi:hypothetical protein